MKKLFFVCPFAVLLFTIAVHADQLYFYGGDLSGNPVAIANENDALDSGNPYGSAVYQNFYALSNITVSGLFTNNLSSITPTSGYWELRSGVSAGNSGTLIASGSGTVTNSPTGRSAFGYTEYTNLVSGLSVSLAPGQYWFAMVPECLTCDGRAFNGDTDGLNSIGKSDLNLEYVNSPGSAENFVALGSSFPTGTSGVYVVPEPGSLMLLGTGIARVIGALRRTFSTPTGDCTHCPVRR